MKKKTVFGKAMLMALEEYRRWFLDSRMLVFIVMLVFIYTSVSMPLLDHAQMMNGKLNVLEPFIAVINSGSIMLIVPMVFLTLIVDFPVIDSDSRFMVFRTGLLSYFIGQMILLLMMTISYLVLLFAGTTIPVIMRCSFGSGWSRVVTHFGKEFPERSMDFASRLLPANLYNQMSLGQGMVESVMSCFAYLIIIGLILLVFTMSGRKKAGFVICVLVISVGTALSSVGSDAMWIFPMANSVVWVHFDTLLDKENYPVIYSVIYLIAVIAGLFATGCLLLRRFNFESGE